MVMANLMTAEARSAAGLLRDYDDGAGWPNASREKEQAFRRNVSAALNTVSQKMEAGEAYRDVIGMALS